MCLLIPSIGRQEGGIHGTVGLKLSEWWWEAGHLVVRQAHPVLWRWELVDVLGRLRSGQWWGQQLAIPFFGLPPGVYGLRWQRGALAQQQLVLWNGD
ncbi:MAG: hypothetical protein ABDH31_01480 [Chlorobiota bacterium]